MDWKKKVILNKGMCMACKKIQRKLFKTPILRYGVTYAI